jgi:hypothetical protein
LYTKLGPTVLQPNMHPQMQPMVDFRYIHLNDFYKDGQRADRMMVEDFHLHCSGQSSFSKHHYSQVNGRQIVVSTKKLWLLTYMVHSSVFYGFFWKMKNFPP